MTPINAIMTKNERDVCILCLYIYNRVWFSEGLKTKKMDYQNKRRDELSASNSNQSDGSFCTGREKR